MDKIGKIIIQNIIKLKIKIKSKNKFFLKNKTIGLKKYAIKKVEEKAKKTDENDEEEKYSNTDLRNTWKSYFINFFDNLSNLENFMNEILTIPHIIKVERSIK